MSIYKIPLPLNILEAAKERITWTLNTLPRICVSFSGGKDSGLMLHLTAEIARQMGKKICVLFIDWEAQFSCTINYVQSLREFYADVIEEFYWVALPLTTQNSLSQYQPEWQCWEPDVEWVRQPPQDAITDPDFFSFYQPGMTFEQFVREFAEWFSQKRPAAMMIGIRADESYNRFVAIASLNKQRFADDKPWTTAAPGGHNSMPEKTAEHYRNKIAIYLHWYQKKGIEVPQTQQGDIGAKDIPSWRRICKVLLNNDYWCRALSFSPTKAKNYQRYNERIKGKRQEWGILCNND